MDSIDFSQRAAFLSDETSVPCTIGICNQHNKAQGESVVHDGIDLHVPVFTHGQLYVAVSRARSVQNVVIIVFQVALLRR